MGRLVDVDDLVDPSEIARRCELTRQAVNLWVRRPDFPEPAVPHAGARSRLWLWPEVVAWRTSEVKRVRLPRAHGTLYMYRRFGCRCTECKAANTEGQRKWLTTVLLAPDDPRHGTTNLYRNYRCRCGPCRAAGSADNRRQRERRQERATR